MERTPDPGDLWARAVETFRSAGAEVVLGEDNCIRRKPAAKAGELPFEVVVEGLPNLLHELVHFLYFGRAEDDHGFDYQQIPYDLKRPEHRRVLWEELSCCTISATYLEPSARDPWFAEQVQILGVFYGYDNHPVGFYAALDKMTQIYAQDLRDTLDEGFSAAERVLFADSEPGSPARCSFASYWRRFRM